MKTTSVSLRYLIQEAALIVVFSYLLLFASTFNGLMEWHGFAILAAVILLVGIAFIIFGQRMKSPMSISVPVFLGTLIISWIFSTDPARSEIEVWLLGVAMLLFFVIHELVGRGWPGELIIKVLLIVGGLIMAFSWLNVGVWYLNWLNASPGKWLPDIAYRLSSPNFMAVLINMLLMACLSRLLVTRSRSGRVILGIYAISAIGLILLTSSRGGWLGTAAGVGVLGLLNFRAMIQKTREIAQGLVKKPLIFGLLILILVAAALTMGWFIYKQASQPTHSTTLEGARSEFWGPALYAFKSSPVIGTGPYTFPSYYLLFNSVPPRYLFAYSHSIYFDLLSSSGIVGGLGFLGLVAVQLVWLRRAYRSSSGMDRAVVCAALAALAAFGVHGIFDSVHHTVPTSAWVLAILVGNASAIGVQPTAAKIRISTPMLMAFILAMMGGVHIWQEVPLEKGVSAGDQQDWQVASAYFTQAAVRKPDFSVAYQQLGISESVLAQGGDKDNLENAMTAFERAVALDPTWGLDHANLAALYRQQGSLNAAKKEIQKAIELAPNCAIYYLNLGSIDEDSGDESGAVAAYQKVLVLEPNWQQAAYWRSNALRSKARTDWGEQNPMKAQTLDEKDAFLDSHKSFLSAYLPVFEEFDRAGKLSTVESLLERARFSYVDFAWQDVELNWYQAALLAEKGDLQAGGAAGYQAIQAWRLTSLLGVGTYGKANYNSFSYRRHELIREVVPQMVVISLPDAWGQRAIRTIQWLEQSGETTQADEVRGWLDSDIPDWEQTLMPK